MTIRPDYYKNNGLEAFDVIKAFFHDKAMLSHAFKYMARAGRKGDEAEDIRKAITYLQTHLEWIEQGRVHKPKPIGVVLPDQDTYTFEEVVSILESVTWSTPDYEQPIYVTGGKK